MKKIRYIEEMALLNAVLALALFMPTISFCLSVEIVSPRLFFYVYIFLYGFTALLLIIVLLPYKEWVEAENDYKKRQY